MSQIIDAINGPFVKGIVNDFLVSLGVALGGVVLGTWGEAAASAGVLSFIVARTAVTAIGKALIKWSAT